MARSNMMEQVLNKGLNISEGARQKLAPIVTRLLVDNSEIGNHVEPVFTMFWQLARKADDMIDYSISSNKRWLEVLRQVFLICSKAESLPETIPAELWLNTISHFFYLMSATCQGEIDDLLLQRPSLSNYEMMVVQKTGPWFTGRITCAAIAAGIHDKNNNQLLTDLQEFGNFVSLAYQIRNDIQDIETEQKDIMAGKLNYPTVLFMLQNSLQSIRDSAKIPRTLYYSQRTIEFANRAANMYEEKARRIAMKYGCRELELLTADLCSSC